MRAMVFESHPQRESLPCIKASFRFHTAATTSQRAHVCDSPIGKSRAAVCGGQAAVYGVAIMQLWEVMVRLSQPGFWHR